MVTPRVEHNVIISDLDSELDIKITEDKELCDCVEITIINPCNDEDAIETTLPWLSVDTALAMANGIINVANQIQSRINKEDQSKS